MFEFDISVLDRVFHIHCVKSFSHVRTDDRYADMEMFLTAYICWGVPACEINLSNHRKTLIFDGSRLSFHVICWGPLVYQIPV